MTVYPRPEEIFSDRQANGCARWPLPESLASTPEVAYRNSFALALSRLTPEEIVKSYVYMTAGEMDRLVHLVVKHVVRRPLAGYGIELGAGCGLLSAVVTKSPRVQGSARFLESFQKIPTFSVKRRPPGAVFTSNGRPYGDRQSR